MDSNLIDVHCHINFFSNAGDIALNCEKRKVHTVYVTTLPSQFDETYRYVKKLQYVYPSLGFHCLENNYDVYAEKKLFLKNIDKTKFIGEVGLDFSKKATTTHNQQIEIFKFVLSNIQNKNKILSVHSASAEDKVLELLIKYEINTVVFHWYSGKISTLKQILENNYYFSINEAMCKSKKGQNIISKLPIDKILIETDAPFIKNVLPYKNTFVYSYLSELWNITIDEVKKQVLKNFYFLSSTTNKSLFIAKEAIL